MSSVLILYKYNLETSFYYEKYDNPKLIFETVF